MDRIDYTDKNGERQSSKVDRFPVYPWCNRAVDLIPLSVHCKGLDYGEYPCGTLVYFSFYCSQRDCNKVLLAEYYFGPDSMEEAGDPLELQSTYPPPLYVGTSELIGGIGLSEDLRLDLTEASKCLESGFYQAYAAMARRLIQMICIEKGAAGTDLYEQINSLKKSGVFSEELAKRAHDIRTLGKLAAHPEWERVDEETAKQSMKSLLWFISSIYSEVPPHVDIQSINKKRHQIPKK